MEAFLALLPQTPEALLALAGKADGLKNPPFLDATGITQVRHAIEVRHESFADPRFIAQLRAHNVALVVADTEDWPYLDQTADFSYARLQGAPGKESYSSRRARYPRRLAQGLVRGQAGRDGRYVDRCRSQPAATRRLRLLRLDRQGARARQRPRRDGRRSASRGRGGE